MFVFVRCVAEAVAEHGVRGLVGMLPGGDFMVNVARSAFDKYRARQQFAALRDDIQQLAAATFEDAKHAAVEAVKEVVATAPADDRLHLELYLTQIPAAVRASLKGPHDPSGRSAPAGFALKSADDVMKMLPPRLPRFRGGEPLPGAAGWTLVEQLGGGGFGEVWLARFGQYGWSALSGAVKFFHGLDTRDLRHELELAGRVTAEGQHPGVVPVIAQNLDADPPWVMYEYVPGGDLADQVRAWAGLPSAERVAKAVAALRGLAEAVGRLHRLSPPVVHRDLKPSNVLFDPKTGALRVTDFGIGGVAASAALKAESRGESTRGGRLLSYLRGSHTPLYSSPQQRDGADPDPRDDVHALGVIGYQMLTGHLAQGCGTDFEDDLREAGADDGLVRVLKQCTAQKLERRPKNATDVVAALTALSPATITTTPTSDHMIIDAIAQYNLGEKYRTGKCVAQDYAEAIRWYRKAADQGHAAAQYIIGFMYDEGQGVAQDYAEALRWYRKAADQGHAGAQTNIGTLFNDGRSVVQDYDEAMDWFRMAADQGSADAQYNIGVLYQNGEGVSQDFAEAMRWYRKAADQGHTAAQYNTGVLYHRGQGVAQNYVKAMRWYRKPADKGDADAQYAVGLLHARGHGVPKDHALAIEWFRKAADQGSEDAKNGLKRLGAS